MINLFSENRATGVAYTLNPLLHPDGPRDTRTVRATKLVLVSAGALGSPGILERSGIGAKDVLKHVGVEQRVDLPGVGENYQGSSVGQSSRKTVPDISTCRSQFVIIYVLCCR
jgi:alcohol oxidase